MKHNSEISYPGVLENVRALSRGRKVMEERDFCGVRTRDNNFRVIWGVVVDTVEMKTQLEQLCKQAQTVEKMT
jgi:hypothetical protein